MSSPELRFPEFIEPWTPAHAGDAFEHSKAKGEAGLPIWSVTLDRGLVPRNSLERQPAADAADESNLRAHPGDLVYNMMRMWQGAVGMASEECMVSPAYVVLSPKEGNESRFFDHWFKNKRMLYLLWAYSHGLTSDRLRLYFHDFAHIPLMLPDPCEQKKIADFLDSVAKKMSLLTEKKSALEDYKKGMMQKLFSGRLRFSRDDGSSFRDWQERKLGDLFSWIKTNSLSRSKLTDDPKSGIQNIHYGDVHGKFRGIFRQSREDVPFIDANAIPQIKDQEFVRVGDVVIADASEDYADIGKSIEVLEVGEKSLIAGLHTFIARPKNCEIVLGFSGYLLHSEAVRLQIMRSAQGISVLGISKSSLEKVRLDLPHPDEQRKIADFLSSIDAKIDAVSAQISAMETFKKGLLQKMFV